MNYSIKIYSKNDNKPIFDGDTEAKLLERTSPYTRYSSYELQISYPSTFLDFLLKKGVSTDFKIILFEEGVSLGEFSIICILNDERTIKLKQKTVI